MAYTQNLNFDYNPPGANTSPFEILGQSMRQQREDEIAARKAQQAEQAQGFINRLNELKGKQMETEIQRAPEMSKAKLALEQAKAKYYGQGGSRGYYGQGGSKKGTSNEMKHLLERQELVTQHGEDSDIVKNFDALISGKSGQGRKPQITKLQDEHERVVAEEGYDSPKAQQIRKRLEKEIVSPKATAQLQLVGRALKVAQGIDYDKVTPYSGLGGKAAEAWEKVTPGTSKKYKDFQIQQGKLGIVENELAQALQIPANIEARQHFHSLFDVTGWGVDPDTAKERLKSNIGMLTQQLKEMQKSILVPVSDVIAEENQGPSQAQRFGEMAGGMVHGMSDAELKLSK